MNTISTLVATSPASNCGGLSESSPSLFHSGPLTAEVLRILLRYSAADGFLYWKPRDVAWFADKTRAAQWHTRYAGQRALTTVSTHGYHNGRVLGVPIFAHRAVWAIIHGEMPNGNIDHINHQRTDNRIENLRCVTALENCRNKSIQHVGKSGVFGVRYHKRDALWYAQIGIGGGAARHIGTFKNFDDAVAARKEAEVAGGYHPNHGQ